MLDLFCGRWGWSRAFAARGWECVGVDLTDPLEIPANCEFIKADVLDFWASPSGWIHRNNEFSCAWSERFDFICASSPCQQFSVWGMPHFHPEPKYPALGIKLFNHTRELCETSKLPYVMENVRPAQSFVGMAKHHCGPFYLWGKGVPTLVNQGIDKGMSQQRDENGIRRGPLEHVSKAQRAARGAEIPPELANCVAEYAERICEQKKVLVGERA